MLVQDIRMLGESDEVAHTLQDLKNVFAEKIKHCKWFLFAT